MAGQVSNLQSIAISVRRLGSLVIVLLLILLGLLWLQGGDVIGNLRGLVSGQAFAGLTGQAQAAPRPGRPAPDFTLTDLNGNQVSLSQFRGKKVVINFWATWCPPCRAEMPDLDRLARDYSGRVVVLAIDIQEGRELVRPFLEEIKVVSLMPLLDTDGKVSVTYKVSALPTTFIINENGIVQEVNVGAINYAWLKARVQ